jgi:mRNA-degrading endonuclease RelE of RelBE toxin-antitoxin system
MAFKLFFTDEAVSNLKTLEKEKGLLKRLKAVRKALAYLETNPRHQGLNTHKYSSLRGPKGEEVFEAYAENKTAAAYRIFFHYGPGKNSITIFAITSHP